MVASKKTITETLKVLRRYLTETQIKDVLRGLLAVRGNRSFRLTVQDLCDLVKLDPKVEQEPVFRQLEDDHAGDDDGG
jgi:hypothetical protein